MSNYCIHVPDKLEYSDYSNIDDLVDFAYNIFLKDLYNGKLIYNDKPIYFFEKPIVDGLKQGFYHCTTTKSEMRLGRTHDVYRLERINWIKPIIENVNCTEKDCSGIISWVDAFTNKTHIYMPDKRYLIVLIEKNNVYDFITAFNVDGEPQHRKLMSSYVKHKR